MKLINGALIKQLFASKRFSVIFSIVCAFIIWLIVNINGKPIMQRTFSDITVNINLENTYAAENDLSIIGDISQQKFTVVVRGPKAQMSAISATDISLYASAATVDGPGDYSLDVLSTALTSNPECEILRISPATINVNFDYIETEEFTITASAIGAVAEEGLIAENGVVGGTESDTVTITGPRAIINKIENVVATAEVNKTLKVSETFDATIILYDAENNVIPQDNITLSTSKVKVTVPISKKKTVPVVAEFSNLPSGFDKTSINWTVDHPTVTVIGTPEAIDKTVQVSLSPIDITTVLSTTASFDVSAKLPEGVRLLDSIDHFTVSLDLNKYISKTISVTNARFTGLGSGLQATNGSVNIKSLKIFGPRSVVNQISSEDVTAIIDLTDKKAGEHTVKVTFTFGDYKNVWQVGTYTTTITIK